MAKDNCKLCLTVKILIIIGALNWGLVAIAHTNIVENIFGWGTISRIIYLLIGLSGVAQLLQMFNINICPMCKKS